MFLSSIEKNIKSFWKLNLKIYDNSEIQCLKFDS